LTVSTVTRAKKQQTKEDIKKLVVRLNLDASVDKTLYEALRRVTNSLNYRGVTGRGFQ